MATNEQLRKKLAEIVDFLETAIAHDMTGQKLAQMHIKQINDLLEETK